ncbi:MAG TPA: GNAT family N-acetyltransferase [Pyrinomonadaceae bacterium]|nr:GNAT family N-acetyltransferase [Pyrinomonadaceae bacterium]
MPDSSRVEIRLLRESDIAAAMDLKNSARWNQTESDWRVLLQLEPNGCFAAVLDEQVVGTTTTTSYGSELAWIGMVLVRPEKRRTGIATKLVQTALAYLEHRVGVVKLDATADGKLVYERLGFEVESSIERWGRKGEPLRFDGQPETMESDTWHQVLQLDRAAFGADRSKLLKLLRVRPVVTKSEGAVTGYGLARAGSNPAYIGPIVSSQRSQAIELLDRLLEQLHPRPVYIDFNRNWGDGQQLLSERGFEKEREFIRMKSGDAVPTSSLVFAIAGPEIG